MVHGISEQPQGGDDDHIVRVDSILEAVRRDILSGKPPREFRIASEPWGTFAFRPAEVSVIAAPPGKGKTALIAQAVVDALRLSDDATALFVNVEMTPGVILGRQISRLSGIPYEKIANHDIGAGRTHLFNDAIKTLGTISSRLAFMKPPYTIERIWEAVCKMEPQILVIDYVQRIQCGSVGSDTRQRLNDLVHEARQIANSGVCVSLVSAVSRTTSKKDGGYSSQELGLGSFRESSEIEYGCDDAYVLGEERVDDLTGVKTMCLKHLKSRNHRCAHLRLEFDGAFQRFRLLPPQANPDASDRGTRVVSPRSSQPAPAQMEDATSPFYDPIFQGGDDPSG